MIVFKDSEELIELLNLFIYQYGRYHIFDDIYRYIGVYGEYYLEAIIYVNPNDPMAVINALRPYIN